MARMSRLLDEALPLDEAERRRWLDALSTEHRDLAQVLREALLPGGAEMMKALATLPKVGSDDDPACVVPSGLKPGSRVGPYELMRPLGTGGMAEVWLARRADGAFKREVALKLPMLTRLRKDLEQRFARERDILASLEHPNIARLYDAGTDSNGLPYLAMEYIAGQPITTWCDAHKLGIPERLQLLLEVLAGVHYAHEQQVIHRDLKPSNILVGETGDVRLLDFGVAKLLESDEADRTQLTSVYGRALTPDYASPELLRGDAVDARSDIYSLGALLYELLTGARPYHLKAGASVATLEQAIATVDLKKPSTQLQQEAGTARAVTLVKLARLLQGDLDVIALKALANDPEERYSTASSMAEDLRRHLRSEAIRAQPPRLSYRVQKFVRRHRTGVTVAAMVAAIIVTTVGYEIHRIAMDQAREIAALPAAKLLGDKSIAVLPFVDLSEKKDQEYFSDGLSEELIDLLTQVNELKVVARTSSFFFKGKPVTVVQIAKILGVAQILEGSVRKAGNTVRVTAQLIRADSGAHLWSQTFDRDVGDIFKVQDDIAAAVVAALKLKLLPGQVENLDRSDNREAYNQFLFGKQFANRGDLEGFRHAIAALRKATEFDPGYAAAYAALSLNESRAAMALNKSEGFERALVAAEKAIALAPRFSQGYDARSMVRLMRLDFGGALTDVEKALSLAPGDAAVQRHNGVMLRTLGRQLAARAALEKAIEIDPLDSASWTELGQHLTADHDFTAARRAFEQSLAISPTSDDIHVQLGYLDLLEGRIDDAQAEFGRTSGSFYGQWGVVLVEHSRGHESRSQHALDALIARHTEDAPYQIAEAYAWGAKNDKAFDWLERAYRQRDYNLSWITCDPFLTRLRDDPRYGAMLRKLKVSE
jgi:serine/threonine protein kinase/tetratricopeptide (TPR) repeat protein